MKRTILAFAAIVALASVAQLAYAADGKPTYTAAMATAPIKIDGVIDGQWDKAVKVPMTPTDPIVTEFGHVWGDNAATCDFRLLWDSKYLYWAFSVKDAQLVTDPDDGSFWLRDCVSGFIGSDSNEISLKFFTCPKDTPYTLTGALGGGAAVNDAVLTGYKITKTGYDVEVALPWNGMAKAAPKAGDTADFTTLLIDQNDSWGQYMWVGDGDTAANMATLIFGK